MNEIVLLMGRGVEGCGVTKFTIELSNYLESVGETVRVVALKDKVWSRKDSHDLRNLENFKFAKDEEYNKAFEICNNAKMIIVNSLPSKVTKKGATATDEAAVVNFLKLLEEVKSPIVMIQHDHNKLSLRRNAGTGVLVRKAVAIFAHSTTGHFADQVNEMAGTSGLSSFLSESKIIPFQPALNFNELANMYWQPIDKQDPLLCRWVGRTTFWKGFVPMFDFHNNYLKDAGFASVMEGIEKSPAYLDFKTKSPYVDMLQNKKPNTIDMKDYRGKDCVVFSIYNNDAMLQRMARSGFGFQLSLLAPHFVEKSIEYTHCEIPAVGVVPVFRKEFGDVCTHRITGNVLTADADSGTIWLPTDKTQMGSAFETLQRLSKDSVERDEWRHKAFEYYRSHQDSYYVFSDLFEKIKTAIENSPPQR